MKTYRFITLIAVIGFLMAGCSSHEHQMTEAEARAEIGEGLRKLWEETGCKAILEEGNSSTGNTLVIIGNDTNYTAETVLETSDGKPLVLKIKPREDTK